MLHLKRNLFTASTVAIALTMAAATSLVAATAASDVPAASRSSAARATSTEVVVYFTRGEHFARVTRKTSGTATLDAAIRALFAGPTRAEFRRGLRSHIAPATTLVGTTVTDGVVTIDVSPEFTDGTPTALRARLAQVVYTATRVAGIEEVRNAVEGVAVEQMGGVALDPPVTRHSFASVPRGGPPPTVAPPPRSILVRDVQRRLIVLGYLPRGAADGIAGPQTAHAILAFQGWEGLRRDGRATEALKAVLAAATRPVPRPGPARRIDVSLRRQVALLVERGRTIRAIHVSTGKPTSPTPPGRFRVFRKELQSSSFPFQVWLPYASYFNRGIAFHESPSVPAFPASAGCVRIPASDSRIVYDLARIGTNVLVRRS